MGLIMMFNFFILEMIELWLCIVVFGVGGVGGNVVNNMIEVSLEGVDFVVVNIDV